MLPAARCNSVAHAPADALSFEHLLARQLQRTPWLLLSVVAHAVLVLVLFVLTPMAPPRADAVHAAIQFAQQPVVDVPLEVQPLDPVAEATIADSVVDEPIAESTPTESVSTNLDPMPSSAFTGPAWNLTLGLSGGAAPPGGGGSGRTACRQSPRPPDPRLQASLLWLAQHQDEDGKWDCDGFMKHDVAGAPCTGAGNGVHDVGVTGLALLAFLGDGNTLRAGPYKEHLKRGVLWLKEQQQDNGRFGSAASNDFVYDHAIAAYAMCEAWGLSRYRLLQQPAQRALDYLAQHRNPYGVWRYQPRDNDNDSSVTGWCVLALESGREFGLQVDANALRAALAWFDQATDSQGRTGYTKAGEPGARHPGDHSARFPPERTEAMTAVALFCRCLLDQDPREQPGMHRAADLILKCPPVADAHGGAIDFYYWYYATYALYQLGGSRWQKWSQHLEAAVGKRQRRDGNFAGSWDPIDVWGEDGGRVYATAMLSLVLQAHFRYTRLVR